MLNFNQQCIVKNFPLYKQKFIKQFGVKPHSWYTYLQWLAVNTHAGNFTPSEITYAKQIMGVE